LYTKRKISVCDIMVIIVTIMALGRCFKFSTNIFFVIVAMTVMVSAVELIGKKKKLIFVWQDIFLLCFPLLLMFNKDETYSTAFCLIYLIGWVVMYILRCNISSTKIVLYIILYFSIINMIVNWINLVSPSAYKHIITFFLIPELRDSAITMYEKYGYLCGLSDHYSRNAYFLVSGIIVLLSFILSGKKKRKVTYLILVSLEILTLLMVGKRGHILFLAISFFVIYILIEVSLWRKFFKIFKYVAVGLISVFIIIYFVPRAGLAYERMLQQINSGDVSTGRFMLYDKAWKLFLEKPLFGNGFGMFNSLSINEVHFAGVHNDYIQWLCEEGIVGFVIYLSATVGIYWISLRVLKVLVTLSLRTGSLEQILIIWSVFFQTFVITYSLTGLPHYDYEINTIYFIACAIPIGLISLDKCKILKVKHIKLKIVSD